LSGITPRYRRIPKRYFQFAIRSGKNFFHEGFDVSDRADHSDKTVASRLAALIPGIALCILLSIAAIGLQWTEEAIVGFPYIEALVIAILLGILVRIFWTPGPAWRPGIAFAAKQLLELAVAFLGASITFSSLVASGPALLGAIVAIVLLMLAVSYGIGRAFGLPTRLSVLIACGNSICGNSAIAAVAPVIGATSDEIASSISFTALLGVIVVIALPLLIPIVGLGETQYGFLAGMTVYAVPQVLAATVPVGPEAVEMGTLVKLVRVLMLGPVCVVLAIIVHRVGQKAGGGAKLGFGKMVPWFILGFLGMLVLRSLGLIPDVLLDPVRLSAGALTTIAMAALGLGVDVRVVARAGGRVTAAVTCSLLMLAVISVLLIRGLGVA
jgi:uncharacterized integral membrane protein (TIGR00698 family)